MINIRRFKCILFFFIVISLPLISPHIANAYIDPNTGGFFFTSVLPFVYGILAAVVIFGKRIVNIVKSKFSSRTNNMDDKKANIDS